MNKEQIDEINVIADKLELILKNAKSYIVVAKFINHPNSSKLSPKQNSDLYIFMKNSELFHNKQLFAWRLFVIEICKVYDREADISISAIKRKLISFNVDISSDLFDQLNSIMNNDLKILGKAKTLRNEYYAHTDENIYPKEKLIFNWFEAENLIINAENFLNYYFTFFNRDKIKNFDKSIFDVDHLWKNEIIELSGVLNEENKSAD